MMLVAIAVILFIWGVVVARVGPVLGTVLAVLPVVLWFGYLVLIWGDGDTVAEHPGAGLGLAIGVIAFTVGSRFFDLVALWRYCRGDRRREE